MATSEILPVLFQVMVWMLPAATCSAPLGDVISITELDSGSFYWKSHSLSNLSMDSVNNPEAENEKKIKLRYEIKARFKIK